MAIRTRQLYRMRTPSTGREVLIEAEPDRVYRDRDTGEELEVLGIVIPMAPDGVAPALGGREPAVLQLVRPARPAGPQRLPDVRAPHGAARVLTAL